VKADEFERVYGSLDRIEWVKGLPSVASGLYGCENAHVGGGGMAYKAAARFIVPLTWHEHRVELHQTLGRKSFEAKYQIDLLEKAAEIEAAWQVYLLTPLRTF
jgi:hypothetical protein